MKKSNNSNKIDNKTQSGFVIEDNIEIPKASRAGVWDFLGTLKVGQSFLITGEDAKVKARQAYQSAIKTHKIRVTTRVMDDGVRIWRVA